MRSPIIHVIMVFLHDTNIVYSCIYDLSKLSLLECEGQLENPIYIH